MQFFLDIPTPIIKQKISFKDSIFLIGSCFTEHIGSKLSSLRFSTIQNPHGILFDSYAIVHALNDYMLLKTYDKSDLFFLNELWHSWNFHSAFSSPNPETAIRRMNESIESAHNFLLTTDWIVITLGSSFSYTLNNEKIHVANCHKQIQTAFNKELIPIDDLLELWTNTLSSLKRFNPKLKILFTISPVRHIRDGVVENNRSKARLIEVVHRLVDKEQVFYFPSYEFQIDVLRDYRFYDIDLVHPNFPATEYILDKFFLWFLDSAEKFLLADMKELYAAFNHRALHPDSEAHQVFLKSYHQKVLLLQTKYPFLNLQKEINYFSA